ncbi:MAG: redoxin domain-containing protein [Actinomycetota bacterium]
MAGSLARPIVGDPAPDVSLPDATGEGWRLSDHRGHPVVLIFHRHIH